MGKKADEVMEGYKETEIGLLPEDWEVVRLGDLGHLTDGDWILKKYYTSSGVRLLQVGDIGQGRFIGKSSRYISLKSAKELGCTFLRPDNILISRMPEPIGRACLMPELPYPCITAVDVTIMTPNFEKVNPSFLVHMLNSPNYFSQCLKLATGTTRKRISRSNLSSVLLPLPTIPEQRKIAYVLSTVQKAIEQQDKIIAAARELKKSLMCHLITYGPVSVDQVDRVPLKETEIGPVPEHWEVVKVNEVGEVITGTTPSTLKKEYYGGNYPFISPGDIDERKYVTKTEKYLTKEGLGASRPLPRNTVLVVCIGATIGKTAMTFFEQSATNQQINAIISNDKILSHYLYYAITWRSFELPYWAGRAAVPIVNKSNFIKFPIPLPPLPEQKQIAHILSTVDKKIEVEEKRKASLQSLFQTMLHLLMTGKVRVKDLEVNLNGTGL